MDAHGKLCTERGKADFFHNGQFILSTWRRNGRVLDMVKRFDSVSGCYIKSFVGRATVCGQFNHFSI